MKKIFRSIALGAFTLTMVACASQKTQTNNDNQPRSGQPGERPQGGVPNFAQILTEMDTNKDGKLAKSEVKGPLADDFSKIDTDNDGYIFRPSWCSSPTGH